MCDDTDMVVKWLGAKLFQMVDHLLLFHFPEATMIKVHL